MDDHQMEQAVSRMQLKISKLQEQLTALNSEIRNTTDRDHTLYLVGEINATNADINILNKRIAGIEY